ncbi:MAG TPA: hypothetical protein P5081_16020, partial [Phycisphaerae bacterium]|nr:hypothetical protein [Phycisphaerae bacterium]
TILSAIRWFSRRVNQQIDLNPTADPAPRACAAKNGMLESEPCCPQRGESSGVRPPYFVVGTRRL